MEELYETNGENLFSCGKVRDIYEMEDKRHLIIITTDRISAYDNVFPNPIPGKGIYLNRLTHFWLDFLKVKDHRVSLAEVPQEELNDFLEMEPEVQDRMMVVRKAEPFPVEVVIRSRLAGSVWEEYQANGTACGQPLPKGIAKGGKIPDGPIMTPAIKAQKGEHDENIPPIEAAKMIGVPWLVVVDMAFDIFNRASKYAEERGIIIADAKFEFGMVDGEVTLIDEVLTPDSSRFWQGELTENSIALIPQGILSKYGIQSYDKQYVRDWLMSTGWIDGEKMPEIPKDVVERTIQKYKTLFSILTT